MKRLLSPRKRGPLLPAVALVAAGITAVLACSQQAVNVPVRTFERSQKVDVVCLHVLAPDPNNPGFEKAIPPVPSLQAQCAPVPPNTDGSGLPYHLYALVTQTARGEIAVVDLTYGAVVDLDRSTPGINFLPVGANPTDLAVTPDGQMTFVAAAEVNKPAIYAIPSKNILGDSQGLPANASPPPPALPSWPVCALPQAPSSIAIVPKNAGAAPAGDAGAGSAEGGADAGSVTSPSSAYEVVVVLSGDAHATAKVVTLDPAPFFRGASLDTSAGPAIAPGALTPCMITSAIELSGDLPPTFHPGPRWDDGVKYADGGVDLSALQPALSKAACSSPAGGGAPANDAGAGGDAGDAGGPLQFAQKLQPHAAATARDGQILYVSDDQVPVIHVIDLSQSGAPRELAPLLATSLNDPARKVSVGNIAVSPPTSDYRRFLYGIDKKDGSVIVYEVTDIVGGVAAGSPRVPLTRPHPELNPFQPPDRIIFNVPAATVAFVRHDFPYAPASQTNVAAKGGLICNPNPNAGLDQGPFTGGDVGLGALYRANVTATALTVPLGPARLRGIFGFVTLTNGQMVAIDVDDWDAPCRRPDPMDPTHVSSDVAPPEPAPRDMTDVDPYHVPVAYEKGVAASPVSLESFFPVSAPHRPRSSYLLRNDPSTGNHQPTLTGVPQLLNGSGVQNGATTPAIMLPTVTNLADPTYVTNPTEPDPSKRVSTNDRSLSVPTPTNTAAVRLSWEDPQVHLDQDWTVTYEGALPGFDGLAATVESTQVAPDLTYQTLTLAHPQALFCRKGIEDFRLGTARATAELAAMAASKVPQVPRLDHTTTDYVQVTDELLDVNDPYWGLQGQDCWDDLENVDADKRSKVRHDACSTNFGAAADQNVQRDFPILEAYDDKLIVGRYGYAPGTASTSSREVVDVRTSNDGEKQNTAKFLKRMKCCFHNQVQFHVRAGAEWVTQGSAVGFLHHITADANGACVQSCDPRESLLNGRATTLPFPDVTTAVLPDRNSALAMRNPMFSFAMWGAPALTRDLVWKFSTRGQFAPLIVSIAASTTAVSPQSMRFIESLGQLALVDGSSQGLVLIDLNTVSLAHTPYF